MRRQRGRPWRCLLCPERGEGVDERETLRLFEKHYASKHMTKESK